MVLKLYKLDGSPPARACMMACELFNIPVEKIDVDILTGEHHRPEFTKKNPARTIPVLEDGDLIIHDSHAILMYLADVYSKEEAYYPKDVRQRALVNQKLFFNSSVLFPRLRSITVPVITEGEKVITEKQLKAIDEAYGYLEEFLTRTKYLAGNHITIADIEAYATTTALEIFVQVDGQKYPKIQAWHEEMEKLPYVQNQNTPGAKRLKDFVAYKLAS